MTGNGCQVEDARTLSIHLFHFQIPLEGKIAHDQLRLLIQLLQDEILEMGSLVEKQIGRSIEALKTLDHDAARRVIETDSEVDRMRFAARAIVTEVTERKDYSMRRQPSCQTSPSTRPGPPAQSR